MGKPLIKKDDQVVVIAGRSRGVKARVMKVFPDKGMALVERVNLVKRHTKKNPQKGIQGGVLEKESPIPLSNLMLICPETGKPTRAGRKRLPDGTVTRVAKVSGATFN